MRNTTPSGESRLRLFRVATTQHGSRLYSASASAPPTPPAASRATGVRSQPVPVALVGECTFRVLPSSTPSTSPLRRVLGRALPRGAAGRCRAALTWSAYLQPADAVGSSAGLT
jgi:hypothetical protein